MKLRSVIVIVVVLAAAAGAYAIYQKKSSKAPEAKYRTEIVADRVQFGPRSSGAGGAGGGRKQQSDSQDEGPAAGPGIEYPKEEINPDDIPF